ncbi:MAG: M14 family metallopeptidase [Proteobacteria bacterium]|nr:M14 family metallopeptidase [Pseudomonadota bacterium]
MKFLHSFQFSPQILPRRVSILSACLAFILLSSCTNLKNEKEYSRVHSDSGIHGRDYGEIVAELKSLEAKYAGVAKVITYGKSLGGEDLTMIRIAKSGNYAQRKGVVIEGSIHGNEFLNIEDRLPKWLLENQTSPGVAKYLSTGGVIWIAPILNPDGYIARRRENNNRKDLNRDFSLKEANKAGFTQPETTALFKTIKQESTDLQASIKLTMDYHCCVGALIYPWGHSKTKQLAAPEKAEHLRIAGIIQNEFPTYKAGRAFDIVNYIAVGAADDFYHETFGATSITFEGAEGVENRNFEKHTTMWDRLLNDIAKDDQPNKIENTDQNVYLNIVDSNNNEVTLEASAKQNSQTMRLCQGNIAKCSENSNNLNFTRSRSTSEHEIFVASKKFAIVAGESYTLQSYDSSNNVLQSRTLKFKTAR